MIYNLEQNLIFYLIFQRSSKSHGSIHHVQPQTRQNACKHRCLPERKKEEDYKKRIISIHLCRDTI